MAEQLIDAEISKAVYLPPNAQQRTVGILRENCAVSLRYVEVDYIRYLVYVRTYVVHSGARAEGARVQLAMVCGADTTGEGSPQLSLVAPISVISREVVCT